MEVTPDHDIPGARLAGLTLDRRLTESRQIEDIQEVLPVREILDTDCSGPHPFAGRVFNARIHQGIPGCTPGVCGAVERAYPGLQVSIVAWGDCGSIREICGVLNGRGRIPLRNIRRLAVRQDTACSRI